LEDIGADDDDGSSDNWDGESCATAECFAENELTSSKLGPDKYPSSSVLTFADNRSKAERGRSEWHGDRNSNLGIYEHDCITENLDNVCVRLRRQSAHQDEAQPDNPRRLSAEISPEFGTHNGGGGHRYWVVIVLM